MRITFVFVLSVVADQHMRWPYWLHYQLHGRTLKQQLLKHRSVQAFDNVSAGNKETKSLLDFYSKKCRDDSAENVIVCSDLDVSDVPRVSRARGQNQFGRSTQPLRGSIDAKGCE